MDIPPIINDTLGIVLLLLLVLFFFVWGASVIAIWCKEDVAFRLKRLLTSSQTKMTMNPTSFRILNSFLFMARMVQLFSHMFFFWSFFTYYIYTL